MPMKRIYPLIATVVLGLLVAGAAVNAGAQQDGLVKVVKIQGKARYIPSGNAAWQDLHLGQILAPGAVIQTASDSYVDLVLNNRNAAEHASTAAPDVMV